MTPQDWHLVTHAWNQTDFDYPRHRTLHQLFEATAAATPDAPAVLFEGSATSFGELNLQANRMANHLRELGVGPGVLVGLAVVRSVDMLVALLGVLKAGGAYVPLDPDYPRERLALLIQDSVVQWCSRRALWPADCPIAMQP
jgi:non-ribosomal peptide synthetase component F